MNEKNVFKLLTKSSPSLFFIMKNLMLTNLKRKVSDDSLNPSQGYLLMAP